jgi:tetratricopeptide (TPR) repeat protein
MFRRSKVFVAVLLFAMSLVDVLAKEKPFVQTETQKIIADSIVADSTGILTYKASGFSQKIKPADYLYARIPMPAEIVSAAKKLKAGKYADAVSGFTKAYKKYRFLGWDVFCVYYRAFALKKLKKHAEAIAALELLEGAPKDKQKNADYFKAVKMLAELYIDVSEFDKAENILAVLGASDDTAVFVFVNNARGDILAGKGQNKDALLMYLRTVLFCTKNNKKERPEALAKIIKILKKDKNSRYSDFEKILKTDYPEKGL